MFPNIKKYLDSSILQTLKLSQKQIEKLTLFLILHAAFTFSFIDKV